MARAKAFHTVMVTWGEKGSKNRRCMRILLTTKQYALLHYQEKYCEYLQWEFNVQQCAMTGRNYQKYDAVIAVEGSPAYKHIKETLEKAGRGPEDLAIVDMTLPEFHRYEERYPSRG